MWIKPLNMPPMTGVASGRITSEPVLVLHMIGSKPATVAETIITPGCLLIHLQKKETPTPLPSMSEFA